MNPIDVEMDKSGHDLRGIKMNSIKTFLNDQTGVTSIEYALIASLVAVVIAMSVTTLGTKVQGLYQKVADAYPTK